MACDSSDSASSLSKVGFLMGFARGGSNPPPFIPFFVPFIALGPCSFPWALGEGRGKQLQQWASPEL